MRAGNICAVEAVDLTHEREYKGIVDEAHLEELVCDVAGGITHLDHENDRAFRVLVDHESAVVDLLLQRIEALFLGDDVIIAENDSRHSECEQQDKDDKYP